MVNGKIRYVIIVVVRVLMKMIGGILVVFYVMVRGL